MTVPTSRTVTPGRAWPLGVTPDALGVNVAVWAPEATSVSFCRFDADGGEERIVLPHRDGEIWHAHLAGIRVGDRYGLRADGPYRPADGLRFNPAKLLVDPYARALDAPLRWHPTMSGHHDGGESVELPAETLPDERDSAPVVPKALVVGDASGPDPAANRPQHDIADLILYEAHVKGLTAAHPDVPVDLRGTYAGLAHPAVIAHLTSLGVNAVELLPVQAFLDDHYLVERGLTNYWGYQPIAWFAPEPRYARHDADAELRALVHALHEAGIEVIVDVVYNHTGEGDELGPTLAHRGLHNTGYYRLADGGRGYINDTGTGNTLATDQPMVLRLILDSLRHWVTRYGVDGFRFDLATVLGRTAHGFDPRAAVIQAMQQDPELAGITLIAEPWDLGLGGYQLGRFPHPWLEWNDRFRDGVRRAWRGDEASQSELGSLLLGSAESFDHSNRAATTSVNFLTAHDGFTLADVVAYAQKHNEANGEGGLDGLDDNHSDNLGVEGPTDDTTVQLARSRRVRAMLATLLASHGVPMLLAGDEIGNSQGGNNNAYAQDNEIGWVDWESADRELLRFVQQLVALRKRLPVLRQRRFLHSVARADGHPDVCWYGADGEPLTPEDWHTPGRRLIVAELRGAAGEVRGEALTDAVLVILNTGDDIVVRLPGARDGGEWTVEVDTARLTAEHTAPAGVTHDGADPCTAPDTYPVRAQSVVILSNAIPAERCAP